VPLAAALQVQRVGVGRELETRGGRKPAAEKFTGQRNPRRRFRRRGW